MLVFLMRRLAPAAALCALMLGAALGAQVAQGAQEAQGAPVAQSAQAAGTPPAGEASAPAVSAHAGRASAPATSAPPSRAARRALLRAQSLLRRELARLPRDSGLTLSRRAATVVLTVPASWLFAPDSEQLVHDRVAGRILTLVGRVLKRQRQLIADIQVYTDNIGGTQHNVANSQQRAAAVMAALSAAGVPVERMNAVGEGLTSAIASNDTPEGRMRNRRVQVVFEPRPAARTPARG